MFKINLHDFSASYLLHEKKTILINTGVLNNTYLRTTMKFKDSGI